MKIDLTGKTALVTGSTAGIGFAIAKKLAEAGAKVIVNGRTDARVAEAVKKIQSDVPRADVSGIAADCSTASGASDLTRKLPAVDILINNVAIFEPKPFFDIPDEDWQRFFDVNIMSAVRLSRHYTPDMVKKGWGRVIFISSESALQIPSEMVHYGMTKTALLSISRGLAETVEKSGVTVNAILPGPTRSEGVEVFVDNLAKQNNKTFGEMESDFFKTARPSSLIKRFITPEEVANLVVYTASNEASATTGSALRVDGGCVRSIA